MLYAHPLYALDRPTTNTLPGLGFLPGLLHAWYIITVTPDPAYSELSDAEGGRVTYYYIPQDQTTPQHHQPRTEQAGYGTVDPSRTPQYGPSNQGPATGSADVGAGEETPPTYQQAVGDRKVQGS